jgi:hypothetical protein
MVEKNAVKISINAVVRLQIKVTMPHILWETETLQRCNADHSGRPV